MQRVLTRMLAAAVAVGAFATPASAGTGGDEGSSRRFCTQFVRYTELRETVDQVRSAVDDPETDGSDRTEAFALIALSGPLGDRADRMGRLGPRPARAGFEDLAEAYRDGNDVLEAAGVQGQRLQELPDEIDRLANPVAGEVRASLPDVVANVGISDATAFLESAAALVDAVDSAETEAVRELPDDIAEQCGAAPTGEYVCDDLVSDEMAADLLGGTIDDTAAGGGCAWGSDDEVLAVEVYVNGASFDLLEARLFEAEPVSGVGDEAAVGTGYTSTASGQGGTSGMTLVVRDGRRTMLVSLSLDDTTPEQLTDLAEQALANI
jgi:hypothetical protein